MSRNVSFNVEVKYLVVKLRLKIFKKEWAIKIPYDIVLREIDESNQQKT